MTATRRTAKLKQRTTKSPVKTGSVAEAVAAAVQAMAEQLNSGKIKPTVAEFVRLLDLQRELMAGEVKHIKVTWVDSLSETEYTTDT